MTKLEVSRRTKMKKSSGIIDCDGMKAWLSLFSCVMPMVGLAARDDGENLGFVKFLVYAMVGGVVAMISRLNKAAKRERMYELEDDDGEHGEESDDEYCSDLHRHSHRKHSRGRCSHRRTFTIVVLLLVLTFLALLAVGFVATWLEHR